MTVRHFIDTQDFTKKELLDIIELTRRIKAADKEGCTPRLLQDASLAMIFEEPSTRPRDRLARRARSQLVVATHSPILLAYPHARIYQLSPDGLAEIEYEKTEHYWLTRDFLLDRERYLRRLLDDGNAKG